MRFGRLVVLLVLTIFVTVTCDSLAGQNPEARFPWQKTNDIAAKVSLGDPLAVGALTDDILSGSALLDLLSTTNPDLRTDLIAAELAYRDKRHPGVNDAKVAELINKLTKRIGAPEFAFTDKAEVRRIRMGLISLVPALFAHDLKRTGKDGKFHVREEMSPLEAVYLFGRVVDQKLSNPTYQLTAQERREKFFDAHVSNEPDSRPNQRTKELLDAVETAVQQQSLRDLASFAGEAVLDLGIRQNGSD